MNFQVGDHRVQVNMGQREELLQAIESRMASGQGFALATLNLDHLVKLRTDPAFQKAYARQDLVTADGNPIVWLSRAANRPVDLLPGSDLIRPILDLARRLRLPVAFVGSTDETLTAASKALEAEMPGLEIRSLIAPPMGFDPEGPEALRILDSLAQQGVKIVLLALGAPKQERLAALGRTHQPGLGFVSIGAGLDFIAGSQQRAPAWVRKAALEWAWRMGTNPRRLAMRYLRCAVILPGHLRQALAQRNGREA